MEAKEDRKETPHAPETGARLATVVLAVTLQRLASNSLGRWSAEEELVLEALRRSTGALKDASEEDLAEYLNGLSEGHLKGVVSNVKGIYHELLFARAENLDGDGVSAIMKETTNFPGADVEFWVNDDLISEVQLKAVASAATIQCHFERYPDIEVFATSEVANQIANVHDSGFSNEELEARVREQFDAAGSEPPSIDLTETLATSSVVAAAFAAKDVLGGKRLDKGRIGDLMANVAVGLSAGTVIDMLIAPGV